MVFSGEMQRARRRTTAALITAGSRMTQDKATPRTSEQHAYPCEGGRNLVS